MSGQIVSMGERTPAGTDCFFAAGGTLGQGAASDVRGGCCVMSEYGVSDYLRGLARAMPFSLPPIEGAALAVLMLVWLFG